MLMAELGFWNWVWKHYKPEIMLIWSVSTKYKVLIFLKISLAALSPAYPPSVFSVSITIPTPWAGTKPYSTSQGRAAG